MEQLKSLNTAYNHQKFWPKSPYAILNYAAKLSGFLQGEAPHTTLDGNPGLSALEEYRWVICALLNRKGA